MIDVATIKVKGGNGGDGKVSFRREKYIPRGGPDGGDGGNGGSVFFEADADMVTLKDFRSKEMFKATDGGGGGKKKMYGENGQDIYIKVPVGTLIYEVQENREVLVADLSEDKQVLLIAKGGQGGVGNWRFRSATNQVPTQYVPGEPGEEKKIKLEIRLVADVGLVGMPNAGKSTLINHLTNANVKVANYPFTTLSPNLGIYRLKNGKTIVISDIPGLIEGASEGKGLGDEFLRHVQRTRVLLHLIDVTDELFAENDQKILSKDIGNIAYKKYLTIRKELENYKKGLEEKKEIITINKIDLTEVRDSFDAIKSEFKKHKLEILGISAASGAGVDALTAKLATVLEEVPNRTNFEPAKTTKLFTIDNLPNKKMVVKKSKVIKLEDIEE